MKLPKLPYQDQLNKSYQVQFGGYNHTEGAKDGEIWDMVNMTSDDYPVLASRNKRWKYNLAMAGAELIGGIQAVGDLLYMVMRASDEDYLYVLDTTKEENVPHLVPNMPALSKEGKYTFQLMPHYLIIMPDKIVLNLETGEVRYMNAQWSGGAGILYNGTLNGIPTWRNTIKANLSSVDFSAWFRVGDTVNISGDPITDNNRSAVIEEIDGNLLRFAENVFEVELIQPTYIQMYPEPGGDAPGSILMSNTITLSAGDYYFPFPRSTSYSVLSVNSTVNNYNYILNKTGVIRSVWGGVSFQVTGESTWNYLSTPYKTSDEIEAWKKENSFYGDHTVSELKIERHIPDFDFMMVSKNRLWGCQKDSDDIYASVLGDPFNFYRSGTGETDSWYTEGSGTHGAYTGCIEYLGYPHFFKENHIFKIYGDRPTNFTLYDIAATGVKAGSEDSLAIAGNVLFYHARIGIMAYTGGSPSLISQSLGNHEFKNAIAGSDDIKYYVFMESAEGEKQLFVYDVSRGLWHVENVGNINSFCRLFNHTWAFFDGNLVAIHIVDAPPKNSTEETEDVHWMAEFAPFTGNSPNVKGVNKIQVRCRHEGPLRIYLQFDDGPWEERYSFTPPTHVPLDQQHTKLIPIIPRRTDNFRLKLEGEGKVKIYSLAIQYNVGSEK